MGGRLAESGLALVEESPEAPRAQRLAIETWAKREAVEIASWQIDVGVSGATPIAERPGLLAAYQAIRDNKAGILVAANADRFGHDELVCWLIERAALTQGAIVQTADGSRGPTRTSEPTSSRVELDEEPQSFSRGALDLARAYERVTLRARIRASLAEKKARGQRIGNLPYGFKLAADGIHTEPDDGEQAVIATVRALSVEGRSQRAIVADLAARGVRGRTGAPLGQTQVAKILRSGT